MFLLQLFMHLFIASDASNIFMNICTFASQPCHSFQIMQQMRTDTVLLTKEEGGSPIQNPPTAAEDARLASLISLDNILKKVKV
jgi:hypothetical protein